MHNEKKPRSGFVRTAFSIAASGALVLSMTPAAWAVETSAGNGTEFAESVQVVDASTATSFEVAESATTLTFSNDGITASGTLNVDGAACSAPVTVWLSIHRPCCPTLELEDMGAYMAETSENQTAGPKKGDSLEALLDMLNGADEQTRVMIATAFAKVQDSRVIEPLARLLFDTSAQVRSLAAHALGAQGDERALWALIDQAHNMEDDALRANCIAALAQMAHPDSFNTVVTALFDLNDAVRANAAIAAGKLRDARALEPLHMLLDDADARVRANTAWALGELAEPASVPALLAAVDAELDANARSGLFLALGTIATPEAAARILAELTDAEATANGRIAALLAAADVVTQGAADPEFVNMVQGSATDLLAHAEDDELRATAAWTLGHLALEGEGRAVAAETLESALTDPYHWVVAYAIESLAILRVPESEAALRSLAARAENDELVALATKAADVVAGTAEMPASPLSAAPGSREPDQQ